MRAPAMLLCMVVAAQALAGEGIVICYNYSCAQKGWVQLGEAQLDEVAGLFDPTADAAAERAAISRAVGRLYAIAGEQTPVWRDRGGDFDDDDTADGRMDCIDHATNTTSWLRLFARRGWLKHHAVRFEVRRGFWQVHWAARIEERASGEQFVVDSWFFDNGRPAVVFALRDWMKGARPDAR